MMLKRLFQEAIQSGYKHIRLDTLTFSLEALHLYQAMGFRQIEPYEGNEIPKDYLAHTVFMEMQLPKGQKI